MIESDESILNQHSLDEWEARAAADLKSGKRGQRPPKELRREFEYGDSSPLAIRWRKTENAAVKQTRQKAAHDAMPSVQSEKRAERVRRLRREGASIAEIMSATGLAKRTVFTHLAKRKKP